MVRIRDHLLKNDGHTSVQLSPEETARWEEAVSGAVDSWVQEVIAAGKDGKAVLDALNGE